MRMMILMTGIIGLGDNRSEEIRVRYVANIIQEM